MITAVVTYIAFYVTLRVLLFYFLYRKEKVFYNLSFGTLFKSNRSDVLFLIPILGEIYLITIIASIGVFWITLLAVQWVD